VLVRPFSLVFAIERPDKLTRKRIFSERENCGEGIYPRPAAKQS